ncbi:MAG TPA: twin-arginine translocase TatA/TatE family subunit [Thermoleophilia bacterium]|nr:twin-arginine translocase TatA/TatE family subunit [Thermoleophilia bacterium]
MPNIGWMEIGVLVVLALIIFGPKRLPELGNSVGKAITNFKRGLKEGEDELRKAVSETSEVDAETKAEVKK